MSFLKKLGTVILKGTQVLIGIAPFLPPDKQPLAQRILDSLEEAFSIVINVEAFGAALGIKGPDKLKAAAGPIAQVILHSSLVAGRKIKDPDGFLIACGKLGGDLADILNSLEGDVKTEDRT